MQNEPTTIPSPEIVALHQAADEAMYQSKRASKNGFRLYISSEAQERET